MEFLLFLTLPTVVSAIWGFVQVAGERRFLANIRVTPSSTLTEVETHIYRRQEAYNHYDNGHYG